MSLSLRPVEPILAPSLLAADFTRLADALALLEQAGNCVVHVDVMDGHFVPNITVGLPVATSIRKATQVPMDCHLMITEPSRYALEFVKAGANWVSVHQEADPHIHRTLSAIRAAGPEVKAGVVLNPSTPVETLVDLVGVFDFVLLMSVNPGFGGQTFIPRVVDKVKRLDALRTERGVPFFIQLDGGVDKSNAADLIAAGADVLVAGSAVFAAKDPLQAIYDLQAEMRKGRSDLR